MNKKKELHHHEILSKERQLYLKGRQKRKRLIMTTQILILLAVIVIWEVGAIMGTIDSFIVSSPSRIWRTLLNFRNNQLPFHIGITFLETMIGFVLGATLGIFIAFTLWWSSFLADVMAPYLVVINALPKIALGPVIIIWVGAGMQAVIVMALAISLVVTILEMLSGFVNTDAEFLKMARTFHASKLQIFTKIVFPYHLHTLFNCLKINIGLSLVGVIAGEFLVSRAGLGYLIIYGGQVFQMDLVMTSVIILAVLAALLYGMVVLIEQVVIKMFFK
ncbi:MAG: ABC transporter permease [Defluviitaleaceae bacterium]|nr:ABC transporter permease [Defluviitaleaceae bacterium]